MTIGTRSLLFGVHQVAWHPLTVWLAWRRLYGRPTWRESVCIVVHDWGYWGAPEMDGPVGEQHPYLGALIAGRLFGPAYRDLVLYHSRSLCRLLKVEPSRLCWADKLSMLYDPSWFYLLRARLTGEIREYRWNARRHVSLLATDRQWLEWLKSRLEKLATEKAGPICADCGRRVADGNGPSDGWEMEDGRTVCHPCCVADTRRALSEPAKRKGGA